MAQYADRCLLLVRTASEGAKQAGLTYLLMDMKAPGVTVRPIHQIQGDEEFAEIFPRRRRSAGEPSGSARKARAGLWRRRRCPPNAG